MTVELWSFSRATLGVDPADLRGMSVEARDGGIGTVVDLVDRIGAACLVVDTGPWIFGRKVLVPAGLITTVDTQAACVFIDRVKDEVRDAPEHDADAPLEQAQRDALTAHYAAAPGIAPEPVPTAGMAEAAEAPRTSVAPPELGLSSTANAGLEGDTLGRPQETGSFGSDLGDAATAPADEQPADVPEGSTFSAPDVPPARRFARGEDSTAGTEESTSASASGDRSSRKPSGAAPISGYDSLTAADVVGRLPNLTQRQLAEVERYEKRHDNRRTVLSRVDSLREKEPWSGYDDETVEEIRKKLSDADDDRARRVRDYERRHRDRKGVMDAARRAVASA